ncbi:MAG: helix-turn-helix domain-containing protein, partial [Synechococcaceae cyanobacterium]
PQCQESCPLDQTDHLGAQPTTMKPIYDAALREAVRLRMSPPNGESVSAIARDTGIAVPTLYSWRSQWQKQGLLVPATSRPAEQWSAADKLATVIQSTGLSGPELGSFCRERGLYPKQVARWRQAAEDANGPSAPSMADQRELQRKNQEQAREIRRLQRELDKKEKALTEAATLLMLSKKFNEIFQPDEAP